MPIYAEADEQLSDCSFAKTCPPASRNYFACFISYGSYLRPVNSVGKVAGYGLKRRDSVPGRVPYLWVLKTRYQVWDIAARSASVNMKRGTRHSPCWVPRLRMREACLHAPLHAFTAWCKEGKIFLFAIRHCCQCAAWRKTCLRNRELVNVVFFTPCIVI
jgi:hypothetical protein